MGWWSETSSRGEMIIGDEPLDEAGAMLDRVLKAYLEDVGRKATVEELEKTLETALSTRVEDVIEGADGMEVSSVAIRLKKKPKRQRIARGDVFSVPLQSGGYGFGRVKGIYLTSILWVEFFDAYRARLTSADEISRSSVLFEAICGYLGLATRKWRVLGNAPVALPDTGETERQQGERLVLQFGEMLAPYTDVPKRLEEQLRRRGRIPGVS